MRLEQDEEVKKLLQLRDSLRLLLQVEGKEVSRVQICFIQFFDTILNVFCQVKMSRWTNKILNKWKKEKTWLQITVTIQVAVIDRQIEAWKLPQRLYSRSKFRAPENKYCTVKILFWFNEMCNCGGLFNCFLYKCSCVFMHIKTTADHYKKWKNYNYNSRDVNS